MYLKLIWLNVFPLNHFQPYVILHSTAIMFVPTLLIAVCYITIVTVVWKKSSFTVSNRRGKSEDSCVELSTIITKGKLHFCRNQLKWTEVS